MIEKQSPDYKYLPQKGVKFVKKYKQKKKRSHIPVRMNILFFVVFLLFSVLVLRLGVVQIVQGEEYKKQVERTDEISVNHAVPRGEIYDRNYNKVVYNVPQKAIMYTPPKNPKPEELYEIAVKLGGLIEMPEADKKKVTERDKKDLWLLENENGKSKVTKKEEKELSDKELYQLKLDRITDEELETVDINVAAIFRKIARATELTPTIVKNEGVTDEEYAIVSENLGNLPNVEVTTDWKRAYTYKDVFRGMLGSVKEGLPEDKVDYYRSKGYGLNDRVGYSYIEESLEDVLQGSKARVKTVTDKNGEIVDIEVISNGQSGRDVVLTIDMELQKEVENIIQEELRRLSQYPRTTYLDKAFVVMMNPKTGDILALAGKKYDKSKKEFLDYAHGTFTASFEPGSVVKGATVLMGYETGVIKPGSVLVDEPMVFKDGTRISSVSTMGAINDLTALERSSNIYMAKIALAVAGDTYRYRGGLNVDMNKITDMRKYYAQFGLGNKTGIGFSNEVLGIQRTPDMPGHLMYLAFGQYDTYTPIQLAQYVSTIANDGYRMKPRLIKEIREPTENRRDIGPIIEETEPVVLNRLDMKEEWIERVQKGFWRVVNGPRGTARAYFHNVPVTVAGKTGTAQSWVDGVQTYNLTFVGYAPYEDPEVAISVVVPNSYYGNSQPFPINPSNNIAQKALEKYFELKEKNNGKKDKDSEENRAGQDETPQAENVESETGEGE